MRNVCVQQKMGKLVTGKLDMRIRATGTYMEKGKLRSDPLHNRIQKTQQIRRDA